MTSGKAVQLTEKFAFDPKEGIDNPAMIISDGTEPESMPRSRLCVLKREEGETYGFNLRVEKNCHGHIIRNVVSGGAAERSGLQDGDRLLEVNTCYVDELTHLEVSRKIRLSGQQLCLLVIDGKEYEKAVAQGQNLRNLARTLNEEEVCKPPRLCHIIKDPASGLGVSFSAMEGEKGRFSVNPVKKGAAEKAGVVKGDQLVWMDGAMVSLLTPSALNRMVKKCGNSITILVIDSESEKIYKKKGMPILPAMAVPHKLPFRARKFHLVSGSEGYGFLLRLEKTSSGRTYHVLRKIERGGPAEAAGVEDGALLLEVNGELVESLRHDEIVDRVRLSGKQVTLTTITLSGLDFYNRLGLSPVLFCDGDDAAEEEKVNITRITAGSASQPKDDSDQSGQRLCRVQKGPLGFEFNLSSVSKGPGTFIGQLAPGGSGESAGLVVGDILVEVNGKNIEDKYLEDVMMLMKNEESCLSLKVMDQESYSKMTKTDLLSAHDIKKDEENDYDVSVL